MSEVLARTFRSRADWLEARGKTLGGSEIPGALFGEGNRSGLVIQLEKLGELPPMEPSYRYRMGLAAEPVVADMAEADLGLAVVEPSKDGPVIYTNTGVPFVHATPDRFALDTRPQRVHAQALPKRARQVVSLKTWTSARREDWGTTPPLYALLQLVVEMLVTGVHVGSITVAFGLAEDHSTYPGIEYHPEIGERIRNEAPLWWQRHIVQRLPVPAVASDQDLLRKLYPTSKPGEFVVLSGQEWRAKYDLLAQRKAELSRIEKEIDALEVQFKERLENAEWAVLSESEAVSWKSHLRTDPPREGRSYTLRPMRLAKPPKEIRDALGRREIGAVGSDPDGNVKLVLPPGPAPGGGTEA